jgi:hypothetical protein
MYYNLTNINRFSLNPEFPNLIWPMNHIPLIKISSKCLIQFLYMNLSYFFLNFNRIYGRCVVDNDSYEAKNTGQKISKDILCSWFRAS